LRLNELTIVFLASPQAAASEVQLLTEANCLMGQRVVELEGLLQGGRSSREVQLEKEMEEVRGMRGGAGRG
jgi:hypothetical protein